MTKINCQAEYDWCLYSVDGLCTAEEIDMRKGSVSALLEDSECVSSCFRFCPNYKFDIDRYLEMKKKERE